MKISKQGKKSMNISPLVSLLIPLYNAEQYFSETIESVLAQTYENIEIIIVDDGSTDNGLLIAQEYEKKFENIKVYIQENQGASTARNKAFSMSRGKYIQYLDADDLLHPEKINEQMKVLEHCAKKTIVFGKVGAFKNNLDNISWKELAVNKNYDDSTRFLLDLWESGNGIMIHSWLIPCELIEESNGWNEELTKNDDGEFFARVVFSAKNVLFVKDSIGYYRRDNMNSLSRQMSRKAIISALTSYETYERLMKDYLNDPQVKKIMVLVYSQFIQNTFPFDDDLMLKAKKKIQSFGFNKPIMRINKYERILGNSIGIYNILRLKKIIKKLINYDSI